MQQLCTQSGARYAHSDVSGAHPWLQFDLKGALVEWRSVLGCALMRIHIHSGVLALTVSILQCVWAGAWANLSVYTHTSVAVSKFVWVPLSVWVTSVIECTWNDCQNADTQVQSLILSSPNALFHQQLVHPSAGSRSRQVVFELKLVRWASMVQRHDDGRY